MSELLFPKLRLSDQLVRDLRMFNPWWEGKPMRVLPETRRHLVKAIHRRLKLELAPIVMVRGPRQIGKTTAQEHVLQDLLAAGIPPKNLFRVQFDELPEITRLSEPVESLVQWYQDAVLGQTLNEAAHQGQPVYLFFDEVQNLADWAAQLKALVGAATAHVIVTGSSALRIARGRDSLAGRITPIEASVLSLTEVGIFHGIDVGAPFLSDNGLDPLTRKEFWLDLAAHGRSIHTVRDTAFGWFSERGGYPLVHQRAEVPWSVLADQLNEIVIKRVIQHDLRVGDVGRKRDAHLLEELFRLACRYAGQTPGPALLAREVSRALNRPIGQQRVNNYLRFLADTLLLHNVEPLERALTKPRRYPKICLSDHGLRASWLGEMIPLDPAGLEREPHLTAVAGHLAESVAGATLSTIQGLDLAHLPERGGNPEVDFVMIIGTRRIPVEIKYHRKIDPLRDTEGLRTFVEKAGNNAPFGLLVTQTDGEALDDPRIVALPLSSLLLLR